MKLYSSNENYKLYHGNMLDMLEVIEPDSIDSIITDPPYELNFMGKGWDNSGIAFQKETWEKCYEVLKPGGYLLAFGGSRTFHRIAVAIEDAGFEIRDTIMWLYGSGFPKSMDISKQIDKKPQANRTIEFKKWLKEKLDNCGKTYKQINDECGFTATSYSKTDFKDNWSTNHPSKEKWLKMKEVIGITETDYDWVCENNIEERGYIEPTGGLAGERGYTVGCYTGKQLSNNAIDNKAKKWQGWGTALKPSFEPIIVARKPFKGSLVDNVIEYGVGGINIDECRVELNGDKKTSGGCRTREDNISHLKFRAGQINKEDNSVGRFPANTILTYDETDYDEVCGRFPDTKSTGGKQTTRNFTDYNGGNCNSYMNISNRKINTGRIDTGYIAPCDSGSASRYFYTAKASKKDRDEGLENFVATTDKAKGNGLDRVCEFCGVSQLTPELCHCEVKSWITKPKKNTHPTVKPTELMQYLIRLVTPDNGVVLDTFNGSGSTGKAVMYENKERNKNYKYIGIELTEEYLPISKARIEYVCNLKEKKDNQMSIFDFIGDENNE